MAKTNKNTQNTLLEELLKKSEFWIGLGVVALFTGIAGGMFLGNRYPRNLTRKVNTPKITVSNHPTPSVTKTPAKKLKQITRLADTAGSYIVVEGDNFWKISKKVCGTGKYFLSIQAQNNAQDLHAGNQLVVNCSL